MSIALAVVRAVLDRARGRRRLAVEARDGRALGAARRQRRAALLPLGQVLRARPDAAARPAHPVRRARPPVAATSPASTRMSCTRCCK